MSSRKAGGRGWGLGPVLLASPPAPPLCGMASLDASLSLGIAMRTFPKGEGELHVRFFSSLIPYDFRI